MTGAMRTTQSTGHSQRWAHRLASLALIALAAVLVRPAMATETVTLFVVNAQGSVVATMTPQGQVTYTAAYRPYGKKVGGVPQAGPGYTGHVMDPASGLVYMQQRYYDPEVGRFISPDPVAPQPGNIFNFGRYTYANDNPVRYTDPNGRQVAVVAAACAASPPCVGAVVAGAVVVGIAAKKAGDAAADYYDHVMQSQEETGHDEPGNTNPYDGPVDAPVIVVDGSGNAIPVGSGEQVDTSPNGDYQQVKDREGNPTGTRLDRGGHRGHTDPKAKGAHGHRPGVTDETGNPHLPVNPPRPPKPPVPPELKFPAGL